MWSDLILATNWALVWLFLIVFAFWWSTQRKPEIVAIGLGKWRVPAWVVVLLVALLVRLVPMLFLPVGAGYDIKSFRLVAEALLAGEDVYTSAAVGRHPYLPFQMYLIGGALLAAKWIPVPFVVWVKLPAVLADVAITAVIHRTCLHRGQTDKEAALWALLYALNPISVLVSAYHGQFDAIPVLLLLLAWYYWHFGRRNLASAVALGFAVLSKTWPVVLLPIILLRLRSYRQRVVYTAVVLVVPFLFTVAYLLIFEAGPRPMLRRALTHTGNAGYWGITAILAVAGKYLDGVQLVYESIVDMRRWLLFGVGFLGLWHTYKQPVLDALTAIILYEFAVTAGMGIQWLLWIVPFALLADDLRWLKWYSLMGMLFLLAQLYGLHMYPWASELFGKETADIIIRLGSIPAWITVVLWVVSRLRRPRLV